MANYINQFRLHLVRGEKKKAALKWIRSIMTCYYLYIAYYGLFKLDFGSINHPNWRNLKNHWWKCITVWNVCLQVRYFVLSFLIDHEERLPKTNAVRKFVRFGRRVQNYCFITLDVPSSISVCSLFWLIQASKRSLFFPHEMSIWIPTWYNHAVHTNPFFVIFFEMFFHRHKNPPFKPAILGLGMHCSMYSACILYTRWTTGQWIYIFIGDFVEDIPRAVFLFLVAGFIFPFVILLICYKLNDIIWKDKFN